MKLAAQQLTPALRTLLEKDPTLSIYTGVPLLGQQRITSAFLSYGPSETNFAPVLRFEGELNTVRFDIDPSRFSYAGIELMSDHGYGPEVSTFYQFDREELGQLVAQGYFEEGFKVPAHLSKDYELEVPLGAEVWILPETEERDYPLIFTDIADLSHLVVTKGDLSVDLLQDFKVVSQEVETEHELLTEEIHEMTLAPEDRYNALEDLAQSLGLNDASEVSTKGTQVEESDVTELLESDARSERLEAELKSLTEDYEEVNDLGTIVETDEAEDIEEEEPVAALVIERAQPQLSDVNFVDDEPEIISPAKAAENFLIQKNQEREL